MGTVGSSSIGTAVALLVLLALNLLAHFVPFERAGFEPDDYSDLQRVLSIPPNPLLAQTWAQPDRPLVWWLKFEVARGVGLSPRAHLATVVLGSSMLTLVVFALFHEVVSRVRSAFVLAALFVLWPAHHPLYGGLLFATVSAVACMYIGSATLFLRFARTGRALALGASLLLYAAGLLSWELGLFVPLVAWGVARRQQRPRHAWALAFFAVVLLYLARRIVLTDEAPMLGPTRVPSWSSLALNVLWVLPSHFVGHIAVRNLLYGWWGFLEMPGLLLALCLICAVAAGACAVRMLKDVPRVDGPTFVWLATSIWVLAGPACLVLVESRHTVFASLAFVALFGQILRRASRGHRWLGGLSVAMLLASNQGLALRQAEAGRLSAAAFSALREQRETIASRRYVVIDLASLAHRIPFTWRPKPYDVLRTYWGLYMFTPWGFRDMAHLAGVQGPYVLGCLEAVRQVETRFECSRVMPSGAETNSWSGPAHETAVLDFEAVCGEDGMRCPPISRRSPSPP